jgi:alpha-1,2-mannosyltransferase
MAAAAATDDDDDDVRWIALAWTTLAMLFVHIACALKRHVHYRRSVCRRILSNDARHRQNSSTNVNTDDDDDDDGDEDTATGDGDGVRKDGEDGPWPPPPPPPTTTTTVVGFYHPVSADGGGGERVLFSAIARAQRLGRVESGDVGGSSSRVGGGVSGSGIGDRRRGRRRSGGGVTCVVYSATSKDDVKTRKMDASARGRALIARAKERFGIELREPIHVIDLTLEKLARAETHKRCTIAAQFLGSAALGFEALWAFTPDVLVDTVGHAAVYPIAKYLFGCKTVAYVHYPTVSSDMIARVQSRMTTYNNSPRFAASTLLTGAKVVYYRAFAKVYGWCGRACSCVMVNSSWTKRHIDELWSVDSNVVYPPCNVETLAQIPLTRPRLDRAGNAVKKDKCALRVVSVGQFRPEKAQLMQIAAWNALKKLSSRSSKIENAVLVFVGGCRDDADRERLADLKQSVKDLELEGSVEFHVDVSFDEVKRQLSRAVIGLHSMVDEHFGICVVEYMAAGAVPIAHASGGPLFDIVRNQPDGITGLTATHVPEFAEAMERLLLMRRTERELIAARARERSKLFTEAKFRERFTDALKKSNVLTGA